MHCSQISLKSHYQRRKDDEEVLQMHIFHAPKFQGEYVNKHFEIFCSFSKVLGKVVHYIIKMPRGIQGKYKYAIQQKFS